MPTRPRIDELLGQEVRIASFPDIVVRVMEDAANERVDNRQLADRIRLDAGLTATVLRRANQIEYLPTGGTGTIREVTELEVALARINRANLIDLVVSSGLADFMSKLGRLPMRSMEFLWRRSVMCGILAQMLSPNPAAYTAGLLQNVGQMVLLSYKPDACREIARNVKLGKSVQDAERSVVGKDHAYISFVLLRSEWKLPLELAAPIKAHHSRISDKGSLASVLHRADILASNLLQSEATDPNTSWTVTVPEHHRYEPDELIALRTVVETKLADALSAIL